MYSRGGRGRGRGGGGNWRQDREDFTRRYQGGGSQGNSYSQNDGPSRDNWDPYDNKRQRFTDSKNYNQQQHGSLRDEEAAGSSYRPQKERPPPGLTGKEIESRGQVSSSWSKSDESGRRYEESYGKSYQDEVLFNRDRGQKEWSSSRKEWDQVDRGNPYKDEYGRGSRDNEYDLVSNTGSTGQKSEYDRMYSGSQSRDSSTSIRNYNQGRDLSREFEIPSKRSADDLSYPQMNKFARTEKQLSCIRDEGILERNERTCEGFYNQESNSRNNEMRGRSQNQCSTPTNEGSYNYNRRQETSFRNFDGYEVFEQIRSSKPERPYEDSNTPSRQQNTSREFSRERYSGDPYRPYDESHLDNQNRFSRPPLHDEGHQPSFRNEHQYRSMMGSGSERPNSSFEGQGSYKMGFGTRDEIVNNVSGRPICNTQMPRQTFQSSQMIDDLQTSVNSEFGNDNIFSDDEISCSGSDEAQPQGQHQGSDKVKRKKQKPLKVIIEGIPMEVLNSEIKHNLRSLGFRVKAVERRPKFNVFEATIFRNHKTHKIYEVKKLVRYYCKVLPIGNFISRVRAMKISNQTIKPSSLKVYGDPHGLDKAQMEVNQDVGDKKAASILSSPDQPVNMTFGPNQNPPPQQIPKKIRSKSIRVFIQNLPMDYLKENIVSELSKLKFTVRQVNRNKGIGVYHVQLAPTQNVMDVFKINKLGDHNVKVIEPRLLCKKPKFANQVLPGPIPK